MGNIEGETSCQILIKFSGKEGLYKVQSGSFYISFIHNRKGFIYSLKTIVTKGIIYNLTGRLGKKRKYKKGGEKLLVSLFDYLKNFYYLLTIENSPVICGAWEIKEFLEEEKEKKNYISLVYEKTDSEDKLLFWIDKLKDCLIGVKGYFRNNLQNLLIKFLNNG